MILELTEWKEITESEFVEILLEYSELEDLFFSPWDNVFIVLVNMVWRSLSRIISESIVVIND
jgi:hypothetical protein